MFHLVYAIYFILSICVKAGVKFQPNYLSRNHLRCRKAHTASIQKKSLQISNQNIYCFKINESPTDGPCLIEIIIKPVIIQAIWVLVKLASILEQVLLFQTSCNHTVILSTLQLSILTNKNAGLGHSSLGILYPYNSNAIMAFIET